MNKMLFDYLNVQRKKMLPKRDDITEYIYDISVKRNAMARECGNVEFTGIRSNIGHYVCSIINDVPRILS